MDWFDSIENLKGIGPKSIQKFGSLGIFTIKDLFFHFPFRYVNIQERELHTILDDEKVTLVGKVVTKPTVSYFGRNKNRTQFKMAVNEDEIIQVVFFNQPYLAKNIQIGEQKAIYGKWQEARQTLLGMKLIPKQFENEDFQAIYHLTQGLKQSQLLKLVIQAFDKYRQTIPEIIPAFINEKYRLMPLSEALYQMHFPTNAQMRKQAERKIIYQEFFVFQWRLQVSALRLKEQTGIEVHYDLHDLREVIQGLPYELTQAQKRVVNEICADLLSPYPMRRLLQGDVGSGKTLVAFLAMLANVIAGYQTALMVPTEILAKQHQDSFNQLFERFGYHAELLVSAMKKSDKDQVVAGLDSGRIRLVIGTHALIQKEVKFNNLGLIIIDEQHRFGVAQRQALLSKRQDDYSANILQMTATPIPRSLAQSIYGDLSVSTIDQLPQGRQPIVTQLVEDNQLTYLYDHMREELNKGRQIYYVLPLIEDSEELEQVESVESVYQRLQSIFPNCSIGLLHGKQTKELQRQMMEEFINHETQILIATTMVEVGVNVPNATMMIIQSAERFGLAQLHQLRGRVGRGANQSFCYLIANPTTEQGKQRMKILVESQDGFYISQEDMKLRGMGDVMGRNQSGLPQFHYANLIEDQHVLTVAQNDVKEILKQPHLISTEEMTLINHFIDTIDIEI